MFGRILGRSSEWDMTTQEVASLPLSLGGIGFTERCSDKSFSILGKLVRFIAHDIKARHPEVADSILPLMHQDWPPSLMAASRAAGELRGVSGFDPPSWQDLANGARPPFHDLDDQEPGVCVTGGNMRQLQECGARRSRTPVDVSSLELIRICFGCFFCVGSVSLCASLCARVDVAVFLTFLHHRASCSRAGVLGRRGFAVESAAARICREGGARVTVNMLVRDMDLPVPNARDARRLEIVADGLPLFGGVQLALDTTLVSPLHCDGSPHRGAANNDGRPCSCSTQEGDDISRADWSQCSMSPGETGGRGGPKRLDRSWSSWPRPKVEKPLGPEKTRRAVLVVSMGLSFGVRGSTSFRRVFVGCASLRRRQMVRCPVVMRWFMTLDTP